MSKSEKGYSINPFFADPRSHIAMKQCVLVSYIPVLLAIESALICLPAQCFYILNWYSQRGFIQTPRPHWVQACTT